MATSFPESKNWRLTEKCGVVGRTGPFISQNETITAQRALEHRGNGPAGVITMSSDGTFFRNVAENIDELPETKIEGSSSIAHNRYATSESTSMENTQPFLMSDGEFSLAFAHNGNIPNQELGQLKGLLEHPPEPGASDSAIMTQLLLESRKKYSSWMDTFIHILPLFKGAFSITCITEDKHLFAIRDPYGIRPLCLGQRGKELIAASESVALDAINATYLREVLPGEIVEMKSDGSVRSIVYAVNQTGEQKCLLETVYFAKKESLNGDTTYEQQRQALGKAAARRFQKKKIHVDWVVPILNSGLTMARGASEQLQVPFFRAIGVNGKKRSFIQNTQDERVSVVYEKHVVWDPEYSTDIANKSILMCDDSAVRGTSLQTLLEKITKAQGNKPAEIHLLLGSEPVKDICDLGVDLPNPDDLLANKVGGKDLDELEERVAEFLGVQSVTYLDRVGVETALGKGKHEMCYHCFGGEHPVRAHRDPIYRKDHEMTLAAQKVMVLTGGKKNEEIDVVAQKITSQEILAQPIQLFPNQGKSSEEELLSLVFSAGEIPDVVVLAGWNSFISHTFQGSLEANNIRLIVNGHARKKHESKSQFADRILSNEQSLLAVSLQQVLLENTSKKLPEREMYAEAT